jgi:uncharacterized heparinase superfamily protein
MRLREIFTALFRRFEFVRRIPLARLARRSQLTMRRYLRDHTALFDSDFAPRGSTASRISAAPPRPLFEPRIGGLQVTRNELIFSFLGRSQRSQRASFDWSAGPSDQLWRMNLHYMEYLEAIENDLFQTLIHSWIGANSRSRPGMWRDSWNSYALSIRVVVWMQQLAARRHLLPSSFLAQVAASLRRQLLFLERNLETDIGGNHLIKNMKALLWGGTFFAGADAARWRMVGLKLLRAELARQILPDGMHYELSLSYHNQVFADLLECRQLLGSEALEGALDRALHAMAQVAADLVHPDGFGCQFSDAGAAMAYSSAQCLAAYTRLCGDPPAPRCVFAFPVAGYFGSRDARSLFVADCGRVAPDDLPAHGHGDALSFEWSLDGERIIIDQGVYEYVAGESRKLARSAESHNTLCFDGADQADFFGAFRCGRRPNVRVLRYEPRADGFLLEGDHDGFCVLPGSPRHRRRFEVAPGQITVRDWIEGDADRVAHIRFLLHPTIEVSLNATQARLRRGGTVIAMTSSLPLACKKATWWPDMGQEAPTLRLSIAMPPGVAEAVTIFRFAA